MFAPFEGCKQSVHTQVGTTGWMRLVQQVEWDWNQMLYEISATGWMRLDQMLYEISTTGWMRLIQRNCFFCYCGLVT